MIITLKGATASKHLGGLNFYSISVNKSSGITVTLDKTTVSKDTAASETVTGTLTVAEGYTLSSVKIMMGDTDKTSAWYNASTGAITISGITANVVITANATANSGSGDSGSGDSGSGDSGTTNGTVDITNQFELQANKMISKATSAGEFTAYTGSWVANENYVDISAYSEIKIKMSKTNAAGTNTGIAFYNADKTWVAGYAHTLGDNQYGIMERTFKRVASPATGQTITQEVIEIPETAVYVRTTYWNTAEGTANYNTSFGEFYCIATPKTTA